jgi:ABC-type polysaccharide/polyol phosphate export permease
MLKLSPWLLSTVGSMKDASTTYTNGTIIASTNNPRSVYPIPRTILSVREYLIFIVISFSIALSS